MQTISRIKVTDFILLLLHGLSEIHKQEFLTGRTMTQKAIYLITANTNLRTSLGLQYRMHYYGPYSSQVAEALEYLTAFGLIEEIPIRFPTFTRYDLRLSTLGKKYAQDLYMDQSLQRRIKPLIDEAAELNKTSLGKVIEKAYAQAKVETLR
jgi:uncharacterized protein YwgA